MATQLLPADVQQRADAEIGAAWRRAMAALPAGWRMVLRQFPHKVSHRFYASAKSESGMDWLSFRGDTEAEALDTLWRALDSRKDGGS